MPAQLRQLRDRPRLVVGTPGRINDHLERGNIMLFQTDFLVLDETDRMLDMGFVSQIEKIMKFLPSRRQTLLFSATVPDNIMKIAQKYLNDPERIGIEMNSSVVEQISQETIETDEKSKYGHLLAQLNEREGSILVFMKTKHSVERMALKLDRQGFKTEGIHGDLRQNKRDRVIAGFRQRKYRILVATDIAARGLDIPHIEHVINYDLPQCPEDYIHRIGRTARAGAKGSSLCLVTPRDRDKWNAISRVLKVDQLPVPVSCNAEGGGGGKRFRKPFRRRNGASRSGGRFASRRNGKVPNTETGSRG